MAPGRRPPTVWPAAAGRSGDQSRRRLMTADMSVEYVVLDGSHADKVATAGRGVGSPGAAEEPCRDVQSAAAARDARSCPAAVVATCGPGRTQTPAGSQARMSRGHESEPRLRWTAIAVTPYKRILSKPYDLDVMPFSLTRPRQLNGM